MWTTGKRAAVATASHFGVVFGLSERVPEKDGVIIGNKGHNGHPYDSESLVSQGIGIATPDLCNVGTDTDMGQHLGDSVNSFDTFMRSTPKISVSISSSPRMGSQC